MTETVPEESSWTMYFEDFLQDQQNKEQYYNNTTTAAAATTSTTFSYGCDQRLNSCNFSISDAGSSSASKKENHHNTSTSLGLGVDDRDCLYNLSFKKRKMKKETLLLDDALEDTATSPLCSPKERGNTTAYGSRNKRSSKLGLIEKDSDCIELKKKGLCLVPLSMLVNYLG